MKARVVVTVCTLLVLTFSHAPTALAQSSGDAAPALTSEQLDQLVAPIALHPDELLSQILMASTYPIEVVEAERWAAKNSSLKGDALAKALDEQTWDPSVKSLINFPDVLKLMSDQLDWLTKLGNAFIAQQSDVLAAVQRLRGKANQAGNLQSNDQQEVIVNPGDSYTEQTIVIESSSPEVVYVPTYNPETVYGTWPYPSYPPYSYYPPTYPWGAAAVSFGIGVACGAAWGYAWGDCDWDGGDIKIDNSNNINFNRDIQNTREFKNARNGDWQHNGEHRRGAAYADQRTADRFGQGASRNTAQARENYRGRAEQGRQQLDRGGAGQAGQRDRAQTQQRSTGASQQDRARSQQGQRSPSSTQRDSSRSSAANRSGGGQSTRNASNRGSSSRSGSAGGGRSGGSRGGASRGGGSRGGGGRRG